MTTITIHNILLTSPNSKPPDDLHLVAKVVTSNNVVIESKPSAMSTGNSWTLPVKSDLPADCTSFDIEISGTSDSQHKDFRLESVHLNTTDIVAKADDKHRFALRRDVNSVDRVLSFHLRVGFSIQMGNNDTGLPGFPLDDRMIASILSQAADRELDSNVINNLHRSIQFLPNAHSMRSRLLAGVGNIYLHRFRQSRCLDALNKAGEIFQEAMLNAPWSDTNIHTYTEGYGTVLLYRFETKGAVDDIKEAVSVLDEAVRLRPNGHPHKASLLNNLGISLLHRFERIGDLSDVNKSVLVKEEAVRLTPDGHSDKPSRLNNLGNSLLRRFERLGDLSDIKKSVLVFEEAVQLTPDKHPDKPSRLNNLGNSLLHRFEHLGDHSDMNKSVLLFEKAVQLIPDRHSDKPSLLNNLGNSLLNRFEHLGDLSDINKSVLVFEEAVQLTPDGHPDKPLRLNNLGNSLVSHFKCLGDLSDINKSVLVFEEAVHLTPDGHPDKPLRLNNLGNSLLYRFECVGDLSDLKKSVLVKEEAVQLIPDGHHEKPSLLNNLGNSLLSCFEHLGGFNNIDRSVLVSEEAVQLTPDGHPDKPLRLNNLGDSLFGRFEHLGDLSDLNKSVLMKKKAVQLTPDGHPDKPSRLNNLGNSLLGRFERLGNLSDINKSVLDFESAVQLTPDGHSDKPSLLNNLGNSLLRRFEHLGDLNDINKSVLAIEKAVQLTPDEHSNKPSLLNNFSQSLLNYFKRLGNLSDMNKSVLVIEKAVQLTPDGHPDKPSRLNNLGNSLLGRFKCLRDLSDIKKSVLMFEEAEQLTPDEHPDKPSRLNNLGISLLHRFEHLGDHSDINTSVLVFEKAVQLIPDGHPDKPSLFISLGHSLLIRFKHSRHITDLEMASKMFENAAMSSTGSSSIRFHSCFAWAMCGQLHHNSTLHPYQRAFELLPTMSWLGLSISDRQHFLKDVGPLVEEAVAAAIDAGQFQTAVEWLEQGHSIIWSQLLQLRTPVDKLQKHHDYSAIADRLTILSKKLEGASTHHKFETTHNKFYHYSSSPENYHELVIERDKLLEHIRRLKGFEQFLLPPKFSQLQLAAHNGPVICINVSRHHSDALILMPSLDDILHIPLEKFTWKTTQQLYEQLRQLLRANGRNNSNNITLEQRKAANNIHLHDLDAESVLEDLLSQISIGSDSDHSAKTVKFSSSNPETAFQHILADLWHLVVKPILDGLAFSKKQPEDALSRVWWFTSGFLSFLPIHAAGIYGEKAFPGSKLSDFVVSSYIPTLSSIINDSSSTILLENHQVLAVALPVESKLPGTKKELECIIEQVGSLNIKTLLESEATLENVIAGLKKSSFVHFACHGEQNLINPNESALLLAKSSRLTISHLQHLSLPHAQLAFLSACQTATGDEALVQESVHLAAGMLSAGYKGVIATMWSIADSSAPIVANEVYKELFKDSEPDPTQAAYALDKAIKKLIKDSNGKRSFLEWVPFIHIGI